MTHHSEPAREAVALDTESIAIGLFANTVAYGVDPRKVWAENATEECKSAFRKTASDLASPAPAAGGLEAVDEMGRDDLRRRALQLLARTGWKPGHTFSAQNMIDLMVALATDVVSNPPDHCAYPECGCCHDATCDRAALAPPAATSAETQGGDGVREAVEDIGFVSAFLRIVAQRQDVPASVRRQIMKAVDVIAALAPSTSAATRGEPVAGLDADERYPWLMGAIHPHVHDHSQARAISHSVIKALESAQVKVKPLEWRARTSLHHYAETPFCSYSAFVDGGWEGPSSSGNAGGSFPEGRAAAEAQHQHDIRASLDLATDAEG